MSHSEDQAADPSASVPGEDPSRPSETSSSLSANRESIAREGGAEGAPPRDPARSEHSVRVPPEPPASTPAAGGGSEISSLPHQSVPADERPGGKAGADAVKPALEAPSKSAGAAQAPPAPRKAPSPPPAPQVPTNPGGAARLAKSATITDEGKTQEPLAGSEDLGWRVLSAMMTIGLLILAGVTLYACVRVASVLLEMF